EPEADDLGRGQCVRRPVVGRAVPAGLDGGPGGGAAPDPQANGLRLALARPAEGLLSQGRQAPALLPRPTSQPDLQRGTQSPWQMSERNTTLSRWATSSAFTSAAVAGTPTSR